MKRFLTTIVVCAMCAVIITGCGSSAEEKTANVEEVKGDTQEKQEKRTDLVMAIGSEPDGGFDPCTGWGRYGNPLIQSTLVDTDPDMNIINDLATGYVISEDGLTITFKLRDDANFTDGEPVKASDVVFTFNTAKSSGSIVDLTAMKECIAVDNNTVEFKLAKPESAFIYTIAATGIVPEHAYDSNYGEAPIGSGPYKFVQWDKGQQIIMEANEDYYGNVPEIKKVTVLFMTEDTAFAKAQAGELDVAITAPNLADQKIEGMTLTNVKTIDNRGLTLPYVKDEGKLTETGYKIGNNITSDIAIRRALSYGINRDNLVEYVINGYGRPAYTECDGMPWGSEDTVVKYDFDKAVGILNDAGWVDTDNDGIREKDGIKAEFTLMYSAGDSTRQALSMAVSEESKKLGISIKVDGVSWDEIDKRMFSEAVLMGWGAQNPTETYLLYHSDNMGKDYYNPENYQSAKVDEYIDMAMSSLDIKESMEYWKKAQWDGESGLATQGDSPWVWLVNVDHLYYVRDGLDIGKQKIHPHGHAWPLVANLKDWKWN